jgi:hypothetical protein
MSVWALIKILSARRRSAVGSESELSGFLHV